MGYTNELDFPNGAMMMLIPEDEVPKVREVCKEYKTFWRHSVDPQKEMTTGIVFRVSCHIKEVYTCTGMLALSPEELAEDRRKSKKNYEVRDEYMNSPRKEKMDKVIMEAWEKLKQEPFFITRCISCLSIVTPPCTCLLYTSDAADE